MPQACFLERNFQALQQGSTVSQPAQMASTDHPNAGAEDTNSLATTLYEDGSNPANQPAVAKSSSGRRKSWFQRLTHSSKNSSSADQDSEKPRKSSISDSGPYIFAFDPRQGKEVLMKNPHWPNEDSWKREEESKGQWAMGSMAGQQGKDFGGTVG